MRKVKKRDEIPLKWIDEESIARRLRRFNDREVSLKTKNKVGKLIPWLEGMRGKTMPIHKIMNRIYNDIDYFMEREIKPASVCTKGCAYCCKVPVQVSLLEADYIANKTGLKIQKLTKNRYKMPDNVNTYCPLLEQDTGLCSVYVYRPLACRLFATIDSYKFCERSDTKHYIHTFDSQPLFKIVHDFLLVHSKDAGKKLDIAAVAEIRDWFKGKDNSDKK